MGSSKAVRERNPRGQGDRLRDEIVAAALALVDEPGSPEAATLRAVARGAGITAPSIYAHFPDRYAVVSAAIVESFAGLSAAAAAALEGVVDPVERLHAGCRGYLRFAAEWPQRYALLFARPAAYQDPAPAHPDRESFATLPGAEAFDVLVTAISDCVQAGRSASTDPFLDASVLWAALHGYATLTSGTEKFPWPETTAVVDILVDRLAQVTT